MSTGTTSLGPMYPMIPHMSVHAVLQVFADACRHSRLPLFHPALDVTLLARADGKRSRRDVLANRRAGAHIGAFTDSYRRDQLAVAADKGAVLDGGRVFRRAVVVARNGSGTDVHVGSDDCVAKVGEVHRLGAASDE